jgi:hypothetical protein
MYTYCTSVTHTELPCSSKRYAALRHSVFMLGEGHNVRRRTQQVISAFNMIFTHRKNGNSQTIYIDKHGSCHKFCGFRRNILISRQDLGDFVFLYLGRGGQPYTVFHSEYIHLSEWTKPNCRLKDTVNVHRITERRISDSRIY